MPTYDVTATADPGPSNVGLKIDGQRMPVGHDAAGNWAMNGTAVTAKNPVPYEFRAVGPAEFPVSFKITVKAQDGSGSGSANSDPGCEIPDDMLLVASGAIAIKPTAAQVTADADLDGTDNESE